MIQIGSTVQYYPAFSADGQPLELIEHGAGYRDCFAAVVVAESQKSAGLFDVLVFPPDSLSPVIRNSVPHKGSEWRSVEGKGHGAYIDEVGHNVTKLIPKSQNI